MLDGSRSPVQFIANVKPWKAQHSFAMWRIFGFGKPHTSLASEKCAHCVFVSTQGALEVAVVLAPEVLASSSANGSWLSVAV